MLYLIWACRVLRTEKKHLKATLLIFSLTYWDISLQLHDLKVRALLASINNNRFSSNSSDFHNRANIASESTRIESQTS